MMASSFQSSAIRFLLFEGYGSLGVLFMRCKVENEELLQPTKDPAFDTAPTRKDDITQASTVEGSDWRSWSMMALQFVWNTRALNPDSELQVCEALNLNVRLLATYAPPTWL
ncbi:hypothetical protein MHU86_12509 [Fragilaria crotonensis]|nr:hypothetical protein MHU86_12509 [Fragilaria crotonensis]